MCHRLWLWHSSHSHSICTKEWLTSAQQLIGIFPYGQTIITNESNTVVQYDQQTRAEKKKCIFQHLAQNVGTGFMSTEYIVECGRLNGEWGGSPVNGLVYTNNLPEFSSSALPEITDARPYMCKYVDEIRSQKYTYMCAGSHGHQIDRPALTNWSVFKYTYRIAPRPQASMSNDGK